MFKQGLALIAVALAAAAVFAAAAQATRPDDRAGVRGAGIATSAVRPDDRGIIRGPGILVPAVMHRVASNGNSFDWADASAGAGAAVGLVALLGGITFTLRRHVRQSAPQSVVRV